MALSFPSSPTPGQTYTDPNGTVWAFDGVKWDVTVGEAYNSFSGAKIRIDTAALLTTTPTPLDYDTEEFDTGDYFDFSNASTLTVRSSGYYRIAGTYYTGPGGSGSSYTFSLVMNGIPITTQISAANQAANYDATVYLQAGSSLYVNVSESTSTGSLLAGSYVEISRLGQAPGMTLNRSDAFSGVRVGLSTSALLTSSYTGISWAAADINVNARVDGLTYWNMSTPSRLTVKVTGYYQIKAFIVVGALGTTNSYNLRLRKNGTTTMTSSILSPNDTLILDEIYKLNENDYIELQANESGSVGSILSMSMLEMIRQGI